MTEKEKLLVYILSVQDRISNLNALLSTTITQTDVVAQRDAAIIERDSKITEYNAL